MFEESPLPIVPSSGSPAISSAKRVQRVHKMHLVISVEIKGPRLSFDFVSLLILYLDWF